MHPLYEKADSVFHAVVEASKEVRKQIGLGLLENLYEDCLKYELELRGFTVVSQKQVDINYKGVIFKHELRADLIVDDCFVIELKSLEGGIRYEHRMQCLTYLKALNYPLGIVVNFGASSQKKWYQRVLLAGATPEEEALTEF